MKRILALLISLKALKFFSNGSDPLVAMKQLGAVMLFLCLLRMAFTSPAIQVEDGRYLDQEVT
jgi:NO-binding membrane sensor protein with MHYT domain